MTDKTVKVGDVVAWNEVPSGAMVKCRLQHEYEWFAIRTAAVGMWVYEPYRGQWMATNRQWAWYGTPANLRVVGPTIIALGLTSNETADDLRALAEAFEREHPAP